jgi:adenosylcobinamide-GDP ribazoletransferase
MGVLAILFALLLKFLSLQEMREGTRLKALLLMPAMGRWALVVSSYRSPYARGKVWGVGKAFVKHVGWREIVVATITSLALTLLLVGAIGLLLFFGLAALTLTINHFIKRRINGVTGDTLGAICESVEVLSLLSISVLENVG